MGFYKKICLALFIPFWACASDMVPRYFVGNLPKPLTALDVHLYNTSYQLQNQQLFEPADFVKSGIDDAVILSWLDYQRIKQVPEKALSFEELRDFLEKYPYHPKRREIYDLAKSMDKNIPPLPKRDINHSNIENTKPQKPVADIPQRTLAQKQMAKRLQQQISKAIAQGDILKAKALLSSQEAEESLVAYEKDKILTKVARLYFNDGQDSEALSILDEVVKRSGDHIAEAWWIAGLSAWRLKDYKEAKNYFLQITKRQWFSQGYVMAAEFWLSRCSLALFEYDEWYKPLFNLAQYDNEYYGLLAGETLGKLFTQDTILRDEKIEKMLMNGEGRSFAALLQLGHSDWAKEELEELLLYAPLQDRAVLSWLAGELGWFDLAYKESQKLSDYAVNASPSLPRMQEGWVPQNGMQMDEALTLAIIMQESRFNPKARSSAGAMGLMQITNQTKAETLKLYRDNKNYDLLNPRDNIDVGQRYIRYLLSDTAFDQNLFLSLSAWNAGPSRTRRWVAENWRMAEEDPLFWVESLPVGETRLFIKKVSKNLWMYRQRLGQKAYTLSSLISGNRPIYKNIDPKQNALQGDN